MTAAVAATVAAYGVVNLYGDISTRTTMTEPVTSTTNITNRALLIRVIFVTIDDFIVFMMTVIVKSVFTSAIDAFLVASLFASGFGVVETFIVIVAGNVAMVVMVVVVVVVVVVVMVVVMVVVVVVVVFTIVAIVVIFWTFLDISTE